MSDSTKFDSFIDSLVDKDKGPLDNKAEMEKRRKEQQKKQITTKLKSELSKPKPNVNAAKAAAAQLVGSIMDESIDTFYLVKALVENKNVNLVFKKEQAKNKWIYENRNKIQNISEQSVSRKDYLNHLILQQYTDVDYSNDKKVVESLVECSKNARFKPLTTVKNSAYDTVVDIVENFGNPAKWTIVEGEYESITANNKKIAEWLIPGTAKYIITYAKSVYNSLG